MQNQEKTKRNVRNLNDSLAKAVGLKKKGSILYIFEYSQVRELMHEIKKKDASAFIQIALKLYKKIPTNATLIPIPSSDGTIDVNLEILTLVQSLRKDIKINKFLQGKKRDSWYNLKKARIEVTSDFFGFYSLDTNLYFTNNTYFFDGVVDTASTYKAACEAAGVKLPLIAFANNTSTEKVSIDLTPQQIYTSSHKIYFVQYFFFGVEISLDEEPGYSKYAHAYCVALSKKDAEDKIRKHALNYFNRVCAIDKVQLAKNQNANYYSNNKQSLIY